MTQEGRYYDETPYQLSEKLAANIWWLIELSQRLNIDIETELEKFLAKREQQLSIDLEKNNDKKWFISGSNTCLKSPLQS